MRPVPVDLRALLAEPDWQVRTKRLWQPESFGCLARPIPVPSKDWSRTKSFPCTSWKRHTLWAKQITNCSNMKRNEHIDSLLHEPAVVFDSYSANIVKVAAES
mmetsp:Transcript_7094/g.14559  ORF Transcript_7094/g.14559 Transcript_7094/m.14559 type:complete len:103 (+) Transcript_7094:1435-1743(+)